MGKHWKQWKTLFWGAPKSLQMVTVLLGRKVMTNLDSILSRDYCANKGPSSQSYGFSSSHVWIWELDFKESWAPKNWCFWTVVLEKTLESPVDCKKIKSVSPKGNQWIFIGRTDAEAETPILWPLDVKNWIIWKAPDAGKEWRWEEKGMTEDDMVGWHHQLNGHSSSKLWESAMYREAWCAALLGVTKSRTQLSHYSELMKSLGKRYKTHASELSQPRLVVVGSCGIY